MWQKSIATIVDRIDPWVLPTHHEPEVPLSVVEVSYQAITQTTVELEEFYLPPWAENSLHSTDCLDMVLPSNEAILEAMCGRDKICKDIHH